MPSTNSLTLFVLVAEEQRLISVDQAMLDDAYPLLEKIDQDMDNGWRLGRRFVHSPSTLERCQVAANRLLTALHTQNQASMTLMAAYILRRLPGVKTVNINSEGEANETMFYDHNDALML
ncbi:MAG: hypothetical protein WBM41_14395 [Arenicellales bacterium]